MKPYTIEMLEDLLDNINISTFVIDEKGQYLYVNKSFAEMLNEEKSTIIGKYNYNYWSDKDCKNFKKENEELFNSKNPKLFNKKRKIDNNIQWIETLKAPIFDENKKPKYIVATNENVNLPRSLTEQLYKNYNKLVKQNHLKNKIKHGEELNLILKRAGEDILDYTKADGFSLLIYDEKIESLKPVVNLKNTLFDIENKELITLKREDVVLGTYEEYCNCILPSKNVEKILNEYNKYDENIDFIGNYPLRLYDEFIGNIFITYNKGNYPKFNCDEYMKYICNKISMLVKNMRLSEEVYVENQKRIYTEKELERYLNISVDLMAIVGKDGYIKKLSPNWEKMLGWSEEELLSMKITQIIHPQDLMEYERERNAIIKEEKTTRNIVRFRHKDGRYITLEWSSEYISDEDIYITSARDITKRLEIENEKRQLEEVVKLEIAKNELFSNISHEFRTPINILLGTTQVMDKNIENNNFNSENFKNYSNYIKQNSYRLLRLANNFIDINKMDMGAFELTCSNENIISIIEDITQSVGVYTKNNKINLVFDTDEEEIITYCDPDKIERIMLNILSNAIKYTPENGTIEVIIKNTDTDTIVSVKDNGVGIPKEKLDVIFDRFEQVNASLNRTCEGSGIGLSLVKNLVEMHGGKISVNSKKGEGCEFIFNIPIKINEENNTKEYNEDRKLKHVEICNIEFSDIYSM